MWLGAFGMTQKPLTYADAGVSIAAGNALVKAIGPLAKSTARPGANAELGGFGGFFDLKAAGYDDPLLVAANDGVGTKLKLAIDTGKHDGVGIDLVAMCANDLIVQGAEPLFFLDYYATGKLDNEVASAVVASIAQGCRQAGCALIGGETAEMPGMYAPGEYDLAGFIVGAVEKKRLLTGSKIKPGDILLGLPSTGLHTNGYSLARKLLFEVASHQPDSFVDELSSTVADELLRVHRSYLKPLHALLDKDLLKGAAHITGGGITENTPRILPRGLGAEIQLGSWPVLPVFEFLKSLGKIPDEDYRRSFNLGIGMIFAIGKKNIRSATRVLDKLGESWFQIGSVVEKKSSRPRVSYV
jgi:phosphoribosylformylglycinamidine cyclo-ligase